MLDEKGARQIGTSSIEFFNKTIPGYGKDDLYTSFLSQDIESVYGASGSVYGIDNFGLHRGTPTKTPRLVTWVRFGVGKYRRPKGLIDDIFLYDLSNQSRAELMTNKNAYIFDSLLDKSVQG